MVKYFTLIILSLSLCSLLSGQACPNRNVALDFDGVDDYLSFPSIGASGNFSIGFWVEDVIVDSMLSQVFLTFGFDNVLIIGVNPEGNLLVSDPLADYEESFNKIAGEKCSHIGYVSEGINRHIYFNFELIATYQSKIADYGPDLLLGNFIFGNFNFLFDGKLDHFRGYDIALSSDEFCVEMNSVAQGVNLQLFYDFQEGMANGNNTNITLPVNKGLLVDPGLFVGFDLTGSESNYSCFSKEIDETLCGNNDPCDPDIDPPFCITSKATLELNDNGEVFLIPAVIDAGSFDACGGYTSSIDKEVLTCENLGVPNIITLTVTDGAGNSSSCQDTIFVFDNIPPTCTSEPTTLNIGPSGTLTINANNLNIQASDNCSVDTIMLSRNTFTCADEGELEITAVVSDFSENTIECNVTLIIEACDPCLEDTVDPFCSAMPGVIAVLDANGNAAISFQDVNFKSFDECSNVQFTLNDSTFTCQDIGQDVSVVLTVTDESGNASTCSSLVNVVDDIPPICTAMPTPLTIDPSGILTIDENDINIQASDNCGIESIDLSRTTFTCDDEDGVVIMVTVTDVAGLSVECPVTLSFDGCEPDPCDPDITPPSCSVKEVPIFQLDETGSVEIDIESFLFSAFDECDNNVDNSFSRSVFTCEDINAEASTIIIVEDESGNKDSCTVSLIIEDNIPPVCIAMPTPLTIGSSGILTIDENDINIQVSDNCGIESIDLSRTTFTCDDEDGVVIMVTVTDVAGLSVECPVTLSFDGCEPDPCDPDITPPSCSVKEVPTFQLDETGTVEIDIESFLFSAFDECDNNVDNSFSRSIFTCDDINTDVSTIIIVEDESGNRDSCTVSLIIKDSIIPVCTTIPTTLTIDPSGTLTIDESDLNIEASDNCGIDIIDLGRNTFTCDDESGVVIEVRVTDFSGNVSFCAAEINFEGCGECCQSETGFNSSISEMFTIETVSPQSPKCIVQLFTPELTECQTITSLDWGDGTVTNGNFPWNVDFLHEYTDVGTFEICVIYAESNMNICFEEQVCGEFEITTDCELTTSTQNVEQTNILLYPNPCRDILEIQGDNLEAINNIVVYDIKGQQMMHFQNAQTHVDVSALPSGLYFIQIISGNTSFIENFIKIE